MNMNKSEKALYLRSLQNAWKDYFETIPKDAGPTQRDETQRAFRFGAMASRTIMEKISEDRLVQVVGTRLN